MDLTSKFSLENNLNRYKSDQEFKDYSNFFLTVISVTIFLAFAIRPSIVSAIDIFQELRGLREYEQQTTQKVEVLNQIEANESNLILIRDLFSEAVPNSPEEGQIIRVFNHASSLNRVTINRISFNLPHSTEDIQQLNFSTEIVGRYENVTDFIETLQNSRRIINIKSITIRPENSGQFINLQLEGTSYYFSDNN